MKGLSQLLLIVMILLIGVTLTFSVYLWATGTVFEIYPEEAQEHTYLRSRACLSLDEIDKSTPKLTITNCGLVPLTNFELYIDDVKTEALFQETLEPKDSSEVVDFALPGPVAGEYNFFIIADYAETPHVRK